MQPLSIVTTSWDDGHPLDLRLADRLQHHGIDATFYIPRQSQLPTLAASEIATISEHFEIGGHTLDHLALTTLSDQEAKRQIVQCKQWLEDVTSRPCEMFCPPLGKFNNTHLAAIADAGYRAFRSVELLQTHFPQHVSVSHARDRNASIAQMPTTVQSHPHRRAAYLRNALKRRRWTTAATILLRPGWSDWAGIAEGMIERVVRHGGVFHLWGHSWEIDDNDQWQTLERVMDQIARRIRSGELRSMTNSQVCAALN